MTHKVCVCGASRFVLVFVEDRVTYGRVKPTVLGAAVLILLAGLPALRTRADDKGHEAHAAHFDHCAKACTECMRECESCAQEVQQIVGRITAGGKTMKA